MSRIEKDFTTELTADQKSLIFNAQQAFGSICEENEDTIKKEFKQLRHGKISIAIGFATAVLLTAIKHTELCDKENISIEDIAELFKQALIKQMKERCPACETVLLDCRATDDWVAYYCPTCKFAYKEEEINDAKKD